MTEKKTLTWEFAYKPNYHIFSCVIFIGITLVILRNLNYNTTTNMKRYRKL